MMDNANSNSVCDEKLRMKFRMSVKTTVLCRRSKLAASFLVTMDDNDKENNGFVPGLSDLYNCMLLWLRESQRLCHDDSPASA